MDEPIPQIPQAPQDAAPVTPVAPVAPAAPAEPAEPQVPQVPQIPQAPAQTYVPQQPQWATGYAPQQPGVQPQWAPGYAPQQVAAQPVAPVALAPDAKKHFSRAGWFVLLILVLMNVGAFIFTIPLEFASLSGFSLDMNDMSALVEILSYAIAIPISLLVFRNIGHFDLPKSNMGIPQLIGWLGICLLVGFVVATATDWVLDGFYTIIGSDMTSNEFMDDLFGGMSPFFFFFVAFLGPIIEEYIFRYHVIRRTVGFGQKNAVLFSALLFGLFHGNLSQCFYTFAIGLVLGYVYVRTGKLRYTIALHIGNNLLSCIIQVGQESVMNNGAIDIANIGDLQLFQMLFSGQLPMDAGMVCLLVGTGLYYLLILVGIICIVPFCLRIKFSPQTFELAKGTRFKTMILNPGFIVFFIAISLEIIIMFVAYAFLPVESMMQEMNDLAGSAGTVLNLLL
ncbi:MAG: CPBP family intramembrane metalloprotease [Coriobacteriales bacterium]|nr:CPBP family intramembrane metalloprotease [Coriobacteriales bacterium]